VKKSNRPARIISVTSVVKVLLQTVESIAYCFVISGWPFLTSRQFCLFFVDKLFFYKGLGSSFHCILMSSFLCFIPFPQSIVQIIKSIYRLVYLSVVGHISQAYVFLLAIFGQHYAILLFLDELTIVIVFIAFSQLTCFKCSHKCYICTECVKLLM
jgi:hypothetical protein